jgi:filamentous hemagglutinin family protein
MENLSNAGMQSVIVASQWGKMSSSIQGNLTVDGSAEVLKEFCCVWKVM